MGLEFDDRNLRVVGNNVRGIQFYDDDRQLRAQIYLDENNNLNIGNLQVDASGDEEGGSATNLSNVPFLVTAGTVNLTNERILTAGDGLQSSDQGGNNQFILSVKEDEIDHDALFGFVADEHVDHTLVSISAGSGLTGGGDISANRTLNVGAGDGLNVNADDVELGTPSTIDETTTNNVTATSHTHEHDATDNPGANRKFLESSSIGGLTLEIIDVDNIRLDANTVRNVSADLILDASGGDVVLADPVNIGSDDFASQLTGWRVTHGGDADFRFLYSDEIHTKAFIADIEQALAGGQIISKSVALLSRNFTIPTDADMNIASYSVGARTTITVSGTHADGIQKDDTLTITGTTSNDGDYPVFNVSETTSTQIVVDASLNDDGSGGTCSITGRDIFVEDLPGFADTQVFADDDWVRLRVIDRSGGGLVVADAWGTVEGYTDLTGGEQSWSFVPVDTSSVIGDVVNAGALVLDYGQSGDGWHEITTLDPDSPYSRIVTWVTDPTDSGNYTVRTQLGNLDGITDGDFAGLGGWGLYSTNAFLKGEVQAAGGDVTLGSNGLTVTGYGNITFIDDVSGNTSSEMGPLDDTIHQWDVGDGTDSVLGLYLIANSSADDVEMRLNAGSNGRASFVINGTEEFGINDTQCDINVDLDVDGDLTVSGSARVGASGPRGKMEISGGEVVLSKNSIWQGVPKASSSGGWARGTFFFDDDDSGLTTRLAGIGMLGSGDSVSKLFMAHGGTPWSNEQGIYVNTSGNVGIMEDVPQTPLHIKNNGVFGIRLENSNASGETFEVSAGMHGITQLGFSIRDVTNNIVPFRMKDGKFGLGPNAITPSGITFEVWDEVNNWVGRFFNNGNTNGHRGIIIQCGLDTNSGAGMISFRDGNGTEIGSVAGDTAGGTDYNTTSDERLKQDITALPSALDRILSLRPVTYRGKGADRRTRKIPGLVAQEVMAVMPEAANYDEESDLYSLAWNKLVPYLIGAVQELSEEVEVLRSGNQRPA